MVDVKVRPSKKRGDWIVLESITYHGICVPKDFVGDGASIPYLIRWAIPKGGRLFAPGMIHDAGYRLGLMTRKEVDDIFLEAMKENKVPLRNIIYRAVRMFGYFAYKGEK